MNAKKIAEANFSDTGYSYTLSLISGKYKPIILYCLMEYEPVRFNEMQRYLGKVADKTLSQNLKELEKDGLIKNCPVSRIIRKTEPVGSLSDPFRVPFSVLFSLLGRAELPADGFSLAS